MKENRMSKAGRRLTEMLGGALIVLSVLYLLCANDGGETLLLLVCMGALSALAALLFARLRPCADSRREEAYKPLWMMPGGLRCMFSNWIARRGRKKAEGGAKAENEQKPDNMMKAEDAQMAENMMKAEDTKKTDDAKKPEDAKKGGQPGNGGTGGAEPPPAGKNNEVFLFDGPDFVAGGKRYRSVNELFAVKTEDPFLRYDRYGRRVLCLRDRFPCFDEFDAMYENRFYRWSLIENRGTLTLVYTADDRDNARVVERVTVSQMERETIDSYDRELLRKSPLSKLLIDDTEAEDAAEDEDE